MGLCEALCAWAELSLPDKHGVTRREHLQKAEEATGKELSEEPQVPEGAGHILWKWFFELNEGRRGGFAPQVLSFSDILVWARLTAVELMPWHVRVLKAMDRAFLGAMAQHNQDKNNG